MALGGQTAKVWPYARAKTLPLQVKPNTSCDAPAANSAMTAQADDIQIKQTNIQVKRLKSWTTSKSNRPTSNSRIKSWRDYRGDERSRRRRGFCLITMKIWIMVPSSAPPSLQTVHIFDEKFLILTCMSSLKCQMRIKILLIER